MLSSNSATFSSKIRLIRSLMGMEHMAQPADWVRSASDRNADAFDEPIKRLS